MAKETLYAFTDINHGVLTGELNALGVPITKLIHFDAGDVFDATDFTETDIANLIQAGALSRVSPIVAEAPPLTAEDAADIAAEDAADIAAVEAPKPTK